MNYINKTFNFIDTGKKPVIVSFCENNLIIEIVSKDKTYSFNCDSITNFQVDVSYYCVSYLFSGENIKYKHKGKEKVITC